MALFGRKRKIPLCFLLAQLPSIYAQYSSCRDILTRSNRDGDDTLQAGEIPGFISRLTSGIIDVNSVENLPEPFQEVFSSRDNSINLLGISDSTATSDILELEAFCDDVYDALGEYMGISVTQNACIGALQIADKNPGNGRVNFEPEFLAFTTSLAGTDFGATTSAELPERLIAVFDDFSGGGEVKSSAGLEYLVKFCQRTALQAKIEMDKPDLPETPAPSAPRIVLTNAPITAEPEQPTITPIEAPVIAPSPQQPISPPVSAPLPEPSFEITDEQYSTCKRDLLIADGDRSSTLSEDEYVRLLNRMTNTGSSTLSSTDSRYQLAFEELAENGSINIAGNRPGQTPTAEEDANLRKVCSVTIEAVNSVQNGPPDDKSPSPVATPAPTSTGFVLTDEFYSSCLDSMRVSDLNGNNLMESSEYSTFIDGLLEGTYAATPFEELDPLFQNAFNENVVVRDSINIFGAKPGDSPDSDQIAYLRQVCSATGQAHFEIQNDSGGSPPTLAPTDLMTASPAPFSPIEGLVSDECQAAINAGGSWTQESYARFVEKLEPNFDSDFGMLPYLLQDNYWWIMIGEESVVIPNTSFGEAYSRYICDRTKRLINQAKKGQTLQEQCEISLSVASSNGSTLTADEYVVFLNHLSGFAWEGIEYDSLDLVLQDLFEERKSGETLDASTESFCEAVSQAIEITRTENAFYQRCKISLMAANANLDDSVSQAEYAVFFNTLDGGRGVLVFEDLPDDAKVNYDLLAQQGNGILVSGLLVLDRTKEEADNLRMICNSVEPLIDSPGAENGNRVTIFNAFVLQNAIGLMQIDLEIGILRNTLENAYRNFVTAQFAQLAGLTDSRRKLSDAELLEETIRLYRIEDHPCPSGASGNCQRVFGSFDVETAMVDSSIANEYSAATQAAIDDGALQDKIMELDPDFQLVVFSSSEKLRPDGGVVPGTASGGDDNRVLISVLTIICGALFGMLGASIVAYYIVQRNLPKQGQDENVIKYDPELAVSDNFNENSDEPEVASTEDLYGHLKVFDKNDRSERYARRRQGVDTSERTGSGNSENPEFGVNDREFVFSERSVNEGSINSDAMFRQEDASWYDDSPISSSRELAADPISPGALVADPVSPRTEERSRNDRRSGRRGRRGDTSNRSSNRDRRTSDRSRRSERGERLGLGDSDRDRREFDKDSRQQDQNRDEHRSDTTPLNDSSNVEIQKLHNGAPRQPNAPSPRQTEQRQRDETRSFKSNSSNTNSQYGLEEDSQNSNTNPQYGLEEDSQNNHVHAGMQMPLQSDEADTSFEEEEYSEEVQEEEYPEEIQEEEYSEEVEEEEVSDYEVDGEDVIEEEESVLESEVKSDGENYDHSGFDESESEQELSADEGSGSGEESESETPYREQIAALMQEVMPEEMENLDAMLEQFAGREAELLETLENMINAESEDEDEDDDEDEEREDEGNSEEEEDKEDDYDEGSSDNEEVEEQEKELDHQADSEEDQESDSENGETKAEETDESESEEPTKAEEESEEEEETEVNEGESESEKEESEADESESEEEETEADESKEEEEEEETEADESESDDEETEADESESEEEETEAGGSDDDESESEDESDSDDSDSS